MTLPGAKYGLINAAFVVFTLVVTDFGIAKVIGGQFNVLATDAYKQVVGQQNFEMGAVVGMVLLAPAVLAFVIDRMVQRRQVALLSARAVPLEPKPNARARHRRSRSIALSSSAILIVGVLGIAVWASFITYWPYNLVADAEELRVRHIRCRAAGRPISTRSRWRRCAAIIGTAIVFTGAYLVEKTKVCPADARSRICSRCCRWRCRAWCSVSATCSSSMRHGTRSTSSTARCRCWSSTAIAHFYTVAHITALTALKQIDPEFESVSASLKVPFWRTFGRVTVPICMPAILDIAVYMFVNALTTVSAVIFLYGAGTKLASIAIVHMDEAGVDRRRGGDGDHDRARRRWARSSCISCSTAWCSRACRRGDSR